MILEPQQTLPWLKRVSARALRRAELEQRRQNFRETLERVRRLSGRFEQRHLTAQSIERNLYK